MNYTEPISDVRKDVSVNKQERDPDMFFDGLCLLSLLYILQLVLIIYIIS